VNKTEAAYAASSRLRLGSWGRGYEPGFAALAVGLIGGMQLPGRLAFLPLGRRLSDSASTATATACSSALAGYGPVLWTLVAASAVAALCFHLAEVWWSNM